jgi:NOL1/NOP2/sun family putative RNA methylase
MEDMLGDEYEEFVRSLGQERYQALRLNRLKININGSCAADMQGAQFPFHMTPVEWADDGYYYEKDDQPGRHPYHSAGVYYIQEPSAMAPVPMLEVKPGDKVLDLCAAPGGKSTQIAAALDGRGLLVCNEINTQRAKILSENIERMGVWNVCVTNEAPDRLPGFFPEYFDRILVDAPCSGEGMFRKNEDACEEWSPENVKMCAQRQDAILDEAAKMLRQGGRLVYSTCTFAEDEDEGSVERFVMRHPEFKVLKMERLWPHKVKGEGHFAAVLIKDGELAEGYESMPLNGLEKGVAASGYAEMISFIRDTLRVTMSAETEGAAAETSAVSVAKMLRAAAEGDSKVRFAVFGDNIYMIPSQMPSVKGLKVLRTGLHVGTFKKNRFEPAHALALAINPSDVKNVVNLDSTELAIKQYLNGQTFPAEGDKGWYLICVDGFSIGWGKLAGGIMKNHYPRGLRVNM